MRFIAIALLALMVAGCRGQPIYNVTNHPIPSAAQAFPLPRIEALIIEAGQSRGWKFDRREAGHLIATETEPKYSATVDIYFDQKNFRIMHKSTIGLKERADGTIHSHYNMWILNLERDIEVRLTNATLAPSS